MLSSDILVDNCLNDIFPQVSTVLIDYFGIDNLDDENKLKIIFGIYQGLIKYKGIKSGDLHKALINNKLNELIKKKNTFHSSQYYEQFNKLKINLDKKINENIEDYKILDDNYCPNCKEIGFITKENNCYPLDCKKCLNIICKLCSKYDEKNYCYNCLNCISYEQTSNLLTNIKKKIKNHNIYDEKRFGKIGNISIEDIKELLKKQKFKCYNCNDDVKTIKWLPFCCYQFSIDRIDNNKPHDRDNVLISCYYCNSYNYSDFNQNYKLCNAKCHTIKKENIPLKDKIDKSIIENLKLN